MLQMNIIFQIDGGLGKSILATAMTKVIRKRYKNANIIVVTAHTDVFLNNPHINEHPDEYFAYLITKKIINKFNENDGEIINYISY